MNTEQIRKSLMAGDRDKLTELVKQSLNENISAKTILDDGLIAGMDEIGQRFKNNEIFIPEVLISAEAMNEALTILDPHLAKSGVKSKGKVVIGTVKGDLHDIGKNLVTMMLKGAGFSIFDCGIDVPPEKFADAVKQQNADVLAMSSLVTTSMPSMSQTLEELKKQNLKSKVKVMVGGAPVTQGFADQIGADGYGEDAAEAVTLAKRFLEEKNGVIQETGLFQG